MTSGRLSLTKLLNRARSGAGGGGGGRQRVRLSKAIASLGNLETSIHCFKHQL